MPTIVKNLLMELIGFLQDLRKQRATGKTKDGACFPLSLSVKLASEVDSSRPNSTGLWRNLFFFTLAGAVIYLIHYSKTGKLSYLDCRVFHCPSVNLEYSK